MVYLLKMAKLIRADYIFIVALLLLFVAHGTTKFLIAHYEDAAKTVQVAEDVALMFEVNPVSRYMFGLESLKHLFSYAIAPGMLTGLYWFLRRRYWNQKEALEGYAVAFLTIMFIDALNDASMALGVLV